MASGFAVLAAHWWLLTHNRLVRLRQQVRAAQKQIDIDLGFRADLDALLVHVHDDVVLAVLLLDHLAWFWSWYRCDYCCPSFQILNAFCGHVILIFIHMYF